MEGTGTSGSVHELLLRLAGRVDDDLMAHVRELLAVREDGRALELTTAALAADGVPLPADVRSWLVAAGRGARIELDADAVLAPAGEDRDEHRFTPDPPAGAEVVVAAVRALPARWLRGCEVRLTWRLTPAGAASGPLPHPVLLVRTGAGGAGTDDVIAYQLATALDRATAAVSVEVLAADHVPSAYHAAAWEAAVAIRDDPSAPTTASEQADQGGATGSGSHRLTTTAPRPHETSAARPPSGGRPTPGGLRYGGAPDARPTADDGRGWTREPAAGEEKWPVRNGHGGADHARPSIGSAMPFSGPSGERAPAQPAEPAAPGGPNPLFTGVAPAGIIEDGPTDAPPRPVPMGAPGGRRRLVEEPSTELPPVTSLGRPPLPGPVPFVRRTRPSPRPMPAVTPEDPADDDVPRPSLPDPTERTNGTSGSHALRDPLLGPVREPLLEPLLDPTSGVRATSGVGDAVGGPGAGREGDWAGDWASGAWAVDDAQVEPHPAGVGDPGQPPDIGLRPESLARLSDADRALLARLQAELVAGRRPHGDGAPTNGAGDSAPPEPSR